MNAHLQALLARPIAHRGLHDRASGVIENSPGAFAAAVTHRFPIECDVQLTADGEAVVFHDYELGRLTDEEGAVDTRTSSSLQAIRLKGSKDGDTIPTLLRMLESVAGRTPIVVEIKSRFNGDLRLTDRVIEVLRGFADHPVVVESFDPRIVAALRVKAPDFARGYVGMGQYEYPDYAGCSADEKHALANLRYYSDMMPDFLSWKVTDLRDAAPFLCREALGLPVSAWTVRTEEQVALSRSFSDQMVFEGFMPV